MRTSNLGPLIAVLSLSAFSFTAGQYLPYVITAISGSGAIAAVPLAIFAVSTVVALASVIYLIKRAISIAGNEKKIDLSGKEFDQSDQQHTEFPEPTKKSVCENGTDLKNKSSTPTLSQHQLTLGVAIPPLTGTPPPPPSPMPTPEQLNQASGAPAPKLTMQTKDDDMFAGIKNVKLKETGGPSMPKANNDLLKAIKKGTKLMNKKESDKREKERLNKLEDVQPKNLIDVLSKKLQSRFKANYSSDSDDEDDDQNRTLNSEWEDEHQTPPNHQSDDEKGTSTPESGYRSDDVDQQYPKIAALPSHQPNTEKPPIPPKPANLQTGPQAPPATTVTEVNSEVKDPSTLPFKDRKAQFEGK
ncbi:hypothetical protein [Wolbachia endosymbiont (group A) of Portevinia maculata]|uniref:hypothetical protein n=1 Tax=Wolbachia endosymbiont (group A) of Portevinia maculata TaxID=3066155 RepID=UPI00333F886E